MSEQVIDPDVLQPADQVPPAENTEAPPPTQDAAPPAEEDDHPEAVEFQPGVKYVPVGALKAVRDELKALKPQAQRAQQLEAEAAENRGIVEFIKANPQILHPQQPAPRQALPPDSDPALVQIAKTLDLYTTDGKPDVQRAQIVRNMTRAEAQAVAQQAIAPIEASTYEARAAQNIQEIMGTTVAGKPIEQQYLVQALRTITTQVPRSEAMRILADPTVKEVVRQNAAGLQALAQGAAPPPKAPLPPVLQTETAGGSGETTYELPESSKRLARAAGIKESDFAARAKKYVPGRSNVLE